VSFGATFEIDGAAVSLDWNGGVTLGGDKAARESVTDLLQPGTHAFYNPVAGGPDSGWDHTDPVHVLMFLRRLSEDGVVIKLELSGDLPAMRPGGYVVGLDQRDPEDVYLRGGHAWDDLDPEDEAEVLE